MSRKIITIILGILLGLGIILFAYNRFSGIINGPILTEINMTEYEYIEGLSKTIIGTTKNTDTVEINGYPIPLTDDERFEHTVALAPGHTIIRVRLEDSFGTSKEFSYTLISEAEDTPYPKDLEEARQAQAPDEESEENEELLLPDVN